MKSVTSQLFKHVRDKKNLSQKQFADKLGINQSTVSRIEKGIQKPRFRIIKKLILLSEKDIDELIREIQKNPQRAGGS